MDLSQFVAHKTTINLCKVGVDITINPFSLLDDSWLQNEFGEERLTEIFSSLDKEENINDLMRIVYHQLDDESKMFLIEQIKPVEYDEDGKKKELKLNGPQKLKYVISGASELMAVLDGLAKAKGLSEPLMKQVGDVTKVKKKVVKKKK